MDLKKGLISGFIGGIVFTIVGFVFMMVPEQSDFYAKTFPQMTTSNFAMFMTLLSTFAVGLFMGLFYPLLNSVIPGKWGIRKGLNYGIIVWLLTGLMWPIMMIGFAPVAVWITEFISGLITYSTTGAIVEFTYEKL